MFPKYSLQTSGWKSRSQLPEFEPSTSTLESLSIVIGENKYPNSGLKSPKKVIFFLFSYLIFLYPFLFLIAAIE